MSSRVSLFGSLSASRRGILWMLLSTLFGSGMDALGKYLVQAYPVIEVIWARSAFHTLIVAVVLRHHLPQVMRTRRPGLNILRSLLQMMSLGLFFTALRFMPLADASAILFTSPLLVAALAGSLLREPAGPGRWLGVIVGFAGALLIIRPGGETMRLATLLPLAGALFSALLQISTRRLSATESPLTLLLYNSVVAALVMTAAVPFVWRTPDAQGWMLLTLMAGFAIGASFCFIKAFEAATASVVSPFYYVSLVWATALGFLVFGELPDRWTVLGMTVIAASGIYIFRGESARARSRRDVAWTRDGGRRQGAWRGEAQGEEEA